MVNGKRYASNDARVSAEPARRMDVRYRRTPVRRVARAGRQDPATLWIVRPRVRAACVPNGLIRIPESRRHRCQCQCGHLCDAGSSDALPFGLGQTDVDTDALGALLGFRITVMAGTADVATTGRFFPKGSHSTRQGATRYERAHNYVRSGHATAAALQTRRARKAASASTSRCPCSCCLHVAGGTKHCHRPTLIPLSLNRKQRRPVPRPQPRHHGYHVTTVSLLSPSGVTLWNSRHQSLCPNPHSVLRYNAFLMLADFPSGIIGLNIWAASGATILNRDASIGCGLRSYPNPAACSGNLLPPTPVVKGLRIAGARCFPGHHLPSKRPLRSSR
jgi:hypothetical protein